jgi:hypothetical protein
MWRDGKGGREEEDEHENEEETEQDEEDGGFEMMNDACIGVGVDSGGRQATESLRRLRLACLPQCQHLHRDPRLCFRSIRSWKVRVEERGS